MKAKRVAPSFSYMLKSPKSEIPVSAFTPLTSRQQISLILKKPLLCL